MLLALATACDDDSAPYIDPEDEPNDIQAAELTQTLADSVWATLLPTPFTEAEDKAPTDPNAPFYDDYYDNWIEEGDKVHDVIITYSDNDASIEYDGKNTQNLVKITKVGAHVTVRNEKVENGEAAGRPRVNYILRGSSTDGSLRVYSNKKFMVTLDGVSLTSATGAAINVQKSLEKKRVFISLANGTVNHLCDATLYSDTVAGEDDKAALFSEGKMIFMGEGQLNVTGKHAHAIAADDRIHIHAGVHLNILSAVKDGLHAEKVVMSGGELRILAEKDALQCDSLSDGLQMRGGRLLTCAHRALSANPFVHTGGDFCLIGHNSSSPTSAASPWLRKQENGFVVVYSE